MPPKPRQIRIEQRGGLAAHAGPSGPLRRRARARAEVQGRGLAILGARAAERYDADAARDYFRRRSRHRARRSACSCGAWPTLRWPSPSAAPTTSEGRERLGRRRRPTASSCSAPMGFRAVRRTLSLAVQGPGFADHPAARGSCCWPSASGSPSSWRCPSAASAPLGELLLGLVDHRRRDRRARPARSPPAGQGEGEGHRPGGCRVRALLARAPDPSCAARSLRDRRVGPVRAATTSAPGDDVLAVTTDRAGRAARAGPALGPGAALGQGPEVARAEAHQRARETMTEKAPSATRSSAALPGHRRRLLRVGERVRAAQAAVVDHPLRPRAVRLRRALGHWRPAHDVEPLRTLTIVTTQAIRRSRACTTGCP